MFRRFLLFGLVVLVALVVVADRVGAVVGAHVLASKLETDEHLPSRPSVSIGGIPFLTQAVNGKYKDVKVTAKDVLVNDVTVTTLTANLHGVHLPLSKVVGGSVSKVPVDRVTGTADVSFNDADAYLTRHLPGGQNVTLSAAGQGGGVAKVKVALGNRNVSFRAPFTPSVSGDVVHVALGAARGGNAGSAVVARVISNVNIEVPLQSLPFQLTLTSVSVGATGLLATGQSGHVVLGSH